MNKLHVYPNNNLSKYSLFIDGSSLIDSIKPLLAFVGQTCCGAFRNTTDLTAVKQGYAYTFTANRVHTNVIKVIATVVYEKSTEVYEYDLTKSSWSPISIFATKDDLPNIFTAKLGTSNQEGNHATTIKGLWNSFPEKQVFACHLVDSNNFCVFGFIYADHKYGTVLYLAYNDCGIVKCNNGTFSDTKL